MLRLARSLILRVCVSVRLSALYEHVSECECVYSINYKVRKEAAM